MSTNESNNVAALYPRPPVFYKYFTQQNIDKLEALKTKRKADQKSSHESGQTVNEANTEDLLSELEAANDDLQYLIPPSLPKSGQFRSFGNIWQIEDELPDLTKMGIQQLYKDSDDYSDKINNLKTLLKTLLLNFLELAGLLSVDPSKYEVKLEHIRVILINIHHLLNDYRPHQTRESLIMLLEDQLAFKKMEIREIKRMCNEVTGQLKELSEL
ncbi:hypothetical protein ACO0RG_000350 [Hanseniaspora osmophila]